MSDKVELIAAAQVNAFGGPAAGIEFKSNFGFKTASRASGGVYELELDNEHDPNKLVVNVTRNNTLSGEIEASVPNKRHVQVNSFDLNNSPADSPFFISVLRVRD